MLFLERPITHEHIRQFCANFNEGIRVEYKSTFDASVRGKLPRILSSLANSHGGVLVIGINTVNGVPQPPFEGFPEIPREELPLTVDNICLQNLNPPIFPKSTVIHSDTDAEKFTEEAKKELAADLYKTFKNELNAAALEIPELALLLRKG